MPRKKAASFTCNQCGKKFAMAMHLGRHMTTLHGQVPKTAHRKKAGKIGGQKGRPVGRPSATIGGMGLHDMALERLADVITSVREEAARRIAQIQELLFSAAPTRPSRAPSQPVVAAPAPKAPAKRKRRKRRKFKLTGRESIVAFVKAKGAQGATTAEIVANWKSQDRSGDGYTAAGELVKAGKLKREPLKGQKGSRYTVS